MQINLYELSHPFAYELKLTFNQSKYFLHIKIIKLHTYEWLAYVILHYKNTDMLRVARLILSMVVKTLTCRSSRSCCINLILNLSSFKLFHVCKYLRLTVFCSLMKSKCRGIKQITKMMMTNEAGWHKNLQSFTWSKVS